MRLFLSIICFLLFSSQFIPQSLAQESNYADEGFFEKARQQAMQNYQLKDTEESYSALSPSVFNPKKPTPSRFFAADISMPLIFATSNNLIKKPGSFYRAFGEVIFLQGKVLDSFGVPISGAVIEIWQANAAGKYHTLLEPDSEYIDKYFNMSGRAVTDNLGNYFFITIMPGSIAGRAPHINANIYHVKFGKLQTEIYFEQHPFNSKDYQYLAYDENDRKMLTASVKHSNIIDPDSIKLFTFNIVMEGIHDYKGF